jgi:hypothetical protein
MEVNDPRLGRIEDGRIQRPSVSISGAAYELVQSTLSIGDGYFVVLDVWEEPDAVTLDELKALIAPKAKKGKHEQQNEAAAADNQSGAVEAGGDAQPV